MADAESPEFAGEGRAIGGGCLVERGPQAAVAGVDAEGPTRLRVDQGELTDIDQRFLARDRRSRER